jgi:N-acetylglucosamine kinase-like BadF-type ATPase
VLAVDGGNSKTDVLLVAADGTRLAAVRGATVSHQAVGMDEGTSRLERLVREASAAAGPRSGDDPVAALGVFCLAGADFAHDVRRLRAAIASRGLVGRVMVLNDTFAALRAGTDEGWGLALVCGEGMNGAGLGPGGRRARFAGIGELSGDWGGGHSLGRAALAAAIRARDGRGPRTALEAAVADHFGLTRPEAVMIRMYDGTLDRRRLSELAPHVFECADAGDEPAQEIVQRLIEELGRMTDALLRRLGLLQRPVPVVLAGGVFSTPSERFHAGLRRTIAEIAPAARPVRLVVPPVLGAALLGLDELAISGRADRGVAQRLRTATHRLRLGSEAPPIVPS